MFFYLCVTLVSSLCRLWRMASVRPRGGMMGGVKPLRIDSARRFCPFNIRAGMTKVDLLTYLDFLK